MYAKIPRFAASCTYAGSFADKGAITGQEASRTISPIRSRACSDEGRVDEGDVRPLSCGHDSDLLDVDLARDHVVPEVGDDLRQQLQAVSSFAIRTRRRSGSPIVPACCPAPRPSSIDPKSW